MDKLIKYKYKILVLVIALLLCIVTVFMPPVRLSAAPNTSLNFDETNVLDDLKSSPGFNINDYPFDVTGVFKSPGIIHFVEYCYSFKENMRSNYGLYLYLYNPQALDIDELSAANTVQMAVSYASDGTPNAYEKFNLRYLNKSTQNNYYNLFYKFKIEDQGNSIIERINNDLMRQQQEGIELESCMRRYDVSGVEIQTKGAQLPKDYTVGVTYKFNGYAHGYGANSNANSTLTADVNELETVQLDVRQSTFRTGVSSLGKGHQNQLSSVYFSVPDYLLEKYGKLQKIKAEWFEYKTANGVVASDVAVYNNMINYIGKQINGPYDNSIPYSFLADEYSLGSGTAYKWGYNGYWKTSYGEGDLIIDNRELALYLLFNGIAISSNKLAQYIYTYNSSFNNGNIDVPGRNISADLFADNVDEGRTRGKNTKEIDSDDKFDMLTYDSNHSGWDRYWEFFGNWGIETGGTYEGIAPIHKVTQSDMAQSDLAQALLVNAEDVADFTSYYNTELAKQRTTFLFRFAQTDYMAKECSVRKDGSSIKSPAYVFQETVFLNFDILTLTFNRDGVYKVVAAVSNPIDVIGAVTPPLGDVGGCGNLSLKSILMIAALILLTLILLPFLPHIINLIASIIVLPVRLIGFIVKGIKKTDKRKSKDR